MITPGIEISVPQDLRTPAERIKDKYYGAGITEETKMALYDELRQLFAADERERRRSRDRDEAKDLVIQYLTEVCTGMRGHFWRGLS